MMKSLVSMKQKLEPLGLYDLSGSGEVDCELKAYAEGLDTLFDTLDELQREYFIQTAESFGLSRRESFEIRERAELPVQERRDSLMYFERTAMTGLTDSEFEEFLERIGLTDYTLTVNHSRGSMNLRIADSKTDGEKALIEKQIRAEIPTHMRLDISYSE